MDTQQMLMMLPGLQPDELMVIQNVTKDMTESQKGQFFTFYQGKRKDQQTLLIMTLIGFLGIAGIQRFVTGETVLGVLYLITFGFCGIGTIIDLIIINRITSEYNQTQAVQTAEMVKMISHH